MCITVSSKQLISKSNVWLTTPASLNMASFKHQSAASKGYKAFSNICINTSHIPTWRSCQLFQDLCHLAALRSPRHPLKESWLLYHFTCMGWSQTLLPHLQIPSCCFLYLQASIATAQAAEQAMSTLCCAPKSHPLPQSLHFYWPLQESAAMLKDHTGQTQYYSWQHYKRRVCAHACTWPFGSTKHFTDNVAMPLFSMSTARWVAVLNKSTNFGCCHEGSTHKHTTGMHAHPWHAFGSVQCPHFREKSTFQRKWPKKNARSATTRMWISV